MRNRRHGWIIPRLAVLIVGIVLTSLVRNAARAEEDVEVVAELREGPGNITVTAEGRIIVSLHQFFNPALRVVEVLPDGGVVPFPTDRWARAPKGDTVGLGSVLGLRADGEGIVWLLDNGRATETLPKLVAWDMARDRLHRVIYLPPQVSVENSFHNDLAIDLKRHNIYIADFAVGENAGLVVVDIDTGLARRVLEGHSSVIPEDVAMIIDGKPVRMLGPDGEPSTPRIGVNPITIDPTYEWVYYGPMHGKSVWRIRAADLADEDLSAEELGARVERYGPKPVSDGITCDSAGNVYITDVTQHAIGVTRRDGTYDILHRDPELLQWPDAMNFGPDGYVYVVANQLHRSAPLNAGEDETEPPFYILRFKPLAPGTVGR